MCLACIEFQKENLTPKEFVRNFIEVINDIKDDKHIKEITKIVDGLSKEYKESVEEFVIKEYL